LLLLEKGADVNARDSRGRTALMGALSIEVGMALIDKGAKINVVDDAGTTPLMMAAHWRRIELVQFLIDRGADVNAQDEMGKTALFHAVDEENSWGGRSPTPVVNALLKANANVHLRSIWGKSVLSMTRKLEDKSVNRILKKAGAKE
ncbi:MAG: ankyrin repeat domain-containing protein, partial [Armatimonadota bacterium]